jgi:eukaryotic-like serine/threonine-protein kinase
MHAEDGADLLDVEAVDDVEAERVSFVGGQSPYRVDKRDAEGIGITRAERLDRRVVARRRRLDEGLVDVDVLRAPLPAKIDAGANDDRAEPSDERSFPGVFEDLRSAIGPRDEQALADDLTDLVDLRAIEPDARERTREIRDEPAFEVGERVPVSRGACARERHVGGVRRFRDLAHRGRRLRYTRARVQCPDENTLAALAGGTIESAARLTCARHLDGCPSCRETVASLVRLAGKSDTPEAFSPTIASDAPPPMSVSHGGELGPGVIVAGKYRLDRVVGEGGLGVVWAATHLMTQKPVALKITKFRFPELDKRFLREARVSGLVNHPNIVDVHDVIQLEHDGSLAMVMDLLEGESLDRHLAAKGRLTVGETMRIMHPVLAALAAAHAVGIVHRDLKPHNIFLSRTPNGVTPMLLDFGLAKMTATEGAAAMTSVLTKEKQLLGTPHYMAPEQLYGELDIDTRTDVWAAGTVLFECLSGQRPLTGNSVGQIMRTLATREIPKVSSVAPTAPPELAAMIDTMLTRDRAMRPATVQPAVDMAAWVIANNIP